MAAVGAFTIRAEIDTDEVWTFYHVDRVAAAIESRCGPDETVFALWSGYPFAANRPWLAGMENHFGLEISERLTVAQRRRYHIPGYEAILDALIHRRAKVLVLGAWMNGINSGIRQERLIILFNELNANYEVVELVGEVKIARPRSES